MANLSVVKNPHWVPRRWGTSAGPVRSIQPAQSPELRRAESRRFRRRGGRGSAAADRRPDHPDRHHGAATATRREGHVLNGGTVDLYNNAYGDFASDVEAAVRRETYGEDIGQSSWMPPRSGWIDDQLAWRREARAGGRQRLGRSSRLPCDHARVLRHRRGHQPARRSQRARTRRRTRGCRPGHLSHSTQAGGCHLDDSTFDAVISNDALCHVANRLTVLGEWARLLRPGGRILFTDAMVITGLVSNEELAIRSSIGYYFFLCPGENERLTAAAGFTLVTPKTFDRGCRGDGRALAQRTRGAQEGADRA